jgi:hypothetical protein
MTTTIIIILLAMVQSWKEPLEHVMYFDPMDTLHIIAACSSGDVQNQSFPDYDQDIGGLAKKRIHLPDDRIDGTAAGFRISDA